MAIHFEQSGFELAPDDIDMLRRVFDRICIEARLPRQDARAGHLARFLMDEFRVGNTDEAALTECGRWLCKRGRSTHHVPSSAKEQMRQTRH